MKTNQEPSFACIFSMNFAALVIQFSTSSLLCPGYNFLNRVSASRAAEVHSTYLHGQPKLKSY